MAEKKLKITLRRSVIGEKPKTRKTVEGLGLRRTQQSVIQADTPGLRGALIKVAHLVEVEEV